MIPKNDSGEGMVKQNPLSERINYYRRLVDDLPNLEPEELLLLQSERDAIHEAVVTLRKSDGWLPVYESLLENIDRDLQESAVLIKTKWSVAGDSSEKRLWWWHLGEINLLSAEEKSTL